MKYAYQVLSVVLCLFVLLAVNISLNSGESWLAKVGNGLAFSEISRLALFAMIGLLLVFFRSPNRQKLGSFAIEDHQLGHDGCNGGRVWLYLCSVGRQIFCFLGRW